MYCNYVAQLNIGIIIIASLTIVINGLIKQTWSILTQWFYWVLGPIDLICRHLASCWTDILKEMT